MPVFIYKAVTKNGQLVRNRVEEMNKFILLKKLKSNDLLPIEVTPINTHGKSNKNKQKRNIETTDSILKTVRAREIQRNITSGNFFSRLKQKLSTQITVKIKPEDISVFTENFYLLKKANFNNIHALTTIIETTENPSLKAILEDILLGVEAGENMYTTMEYYTSVFPPIYVNMIKVGELSGSLSTALEQAVKYMDDSITTRKRINSVLVPNLVQFFVLLILLIVGTAVGVPLIQNVYSSVGSTEQLPAITLWFSGVLKWISMYWYIPLLIIGGIVSAIALYVKTPQGKYNYHYFKYKRPLLGQLTYAIDFSRLIKALLLNIKNGMRIQDALETSKNSTNNLVMMSLIESSINNIIVGQSWIEPFEKSGLSTPMITEMLKVGMQTDLGEMMEKLVEYMDVDINNIMQKLMKALPQVVYIIVGILLIFVTIVVLVPMIQVYMGTWMLSAYL
jgi:type II secretory pathway component PulF